MIGVVHLVDAEADQSDCDQKRILDVNRDESEISASI